MKQEVLPKDHCKQYTIHTAHKQLHTSTGRSQQCVPGVVSSDQPPRSLMSCLQKWLHSDSDPPRDLTGEGGEEGRAAGR